MSINEGSCRITVGDNFLTEYNGQAVVGLGAATDWSIKLCGNPDDPSSKFTFSKGKGMPDGTEYVLTLDKSNAEEEATNISVSPIEDPPSKEQMWTCEDEIIQPRHPPIIHCRIQSVACPNLSAAVGGGNIPLPKIYQNVTAVPNDQAPKWRLDYFLVDKD